MSKNLEKGASFGKLYNFVRQEHNDIVSNTDYDASNTRLRYGTIPSMIRPDSRTVIHGQNINVRTLEKYTGPFAVSLEEDLINSQYKIIVNADIYEGVDARVYAGTTLVPRLPDSPLIFTYPLPYFYDKLYVSARVGCYDPNTMQLITDFFSATLFSLYWDVTCETYMPHPTRATFIRPLAEISFDENGFYTKVQQWWHSGWIYVDGRIV